MQSLANYRAMHMRMQQLAAEGALDAGPAGEEEEEEGAAAAGEAGGEAGGGAGAGEEGRGPTSDLDGFAAKLNAILQVCTAGSARWQRQWVVGWGWQCQVAAAVGSGGFKPWCCLGRRDVPRA